MLPEFVGRVFPELVGAILPVVETFPVFVAGGVVSAILVIFVDFSAIFPAPSYTRISTLY